ncbi:hypothetical protein LX36DRAFT_320726 [Colletotrichum falcatum]|nr:hypothetical protein LX36DRAFT_320726 [Colletotrichum falcatum]
MSTPLDGPLPTRHPPAPPARLLLRISCGPVGVQAAIRHIASCRWYSALVQPRPLWTGVLFVSFSSSLPPPLLMQRCTPWPVYLGSDIGEEALVFVVSSQPRFASSGEKEKIRGEEEEEEEEKASSKGPPRMSTPPASPRSKWAAAEGSAATQPCGNLFFSLSHVASNKHVSTSELTSSPPHPSVNPFYPPPKGSKKNVSTTSRKDQETGMGWRGGEAPSLCP